MSNPNPAVRATRAATQALADLARTARPLVIIQSAGCCDGSGPMVLPAADFRTGASDVLAGTVAGTPVYIAERELRAWPHGDLELGVEAGYADGFWLAPGEGLHFVTHSECCPSGGEGHRDDVRS